MHVWVSEGLCDKDYVAARTTGFDEWKAYLLGEIDAVPKTPEWQEEETGVPARDARALARMWGRQEGLSGCRNERRGIRRRRPRRDGAAMGALHDHDDGDARLGQAGRQFRRSRARRSA